MPDPSIGDAKTSAGRDATAADILAPGTLFGQYRILRLLGRGGMGEVYEVEHKVLRRKYALKLLPPTLEWRGVALERFEREAQVMANLEHPNVLKVDEFGETEGRYWLRMELAGGVEEVSGVGFQVSGKRVVSLQDLADARGGKIPQNELLAILKQVLAGLDYAHQRGAIHRDLKPSNILLFPSPQSSQSPTTPLLKITDFGLVRLVGEDWVRSQAQLTVQRSMSLGDQPTMGKAEPEGTSTRSLLGTYEYMSPEQKRGEDADACSDLYAVGVMTYRLLTGRNISPKPPSRVDPALDPDWDELVVSALEEERADRITNAQSFRKRLERIEQSLAEKARTEERARQQRETEEQETARRRVEAERKREAEARRRAAEETEKREQSRSIAAKSQPAPPPTPKVAVARGWVRWLPLMATAVVIGVLGGSWLATRKESPPPRPVPSGTTRTLDLGGGVTMDLVWIPAGNFTMGSPDNEANRRSDEGPQQQVRISEGFWMGKYEVTQEQWQKVMGSNPSNFKGPKNPVEQVSWTEAKKFCAKAGGRLPTEAEWEYACRAGTTGPYAGNLDAMAWYAGNSGNTAHPVGQKQSNAWGLYDMHGNVWEWCEDWYAYKLSPGGVGPASGSYRVYRGGCWGNEARYCRSAVRTWDEPGLRGGHLGIRLVRASL